MGWGDFIGRINCGVKSNKILENYLKFPVCQFVLRAVGYGFSIHSHFHSEVDVLCHWDRWGFLMGNFPWWLILINRGVSKAMEKGKSTLVTKMGTCY